MNEIVNKFLLAGDKFMPKMHLRPFTKNRERTQKLKKPRDSRYIYQNELHKACFQHDMAYGGFKDLTRRIAPDKILRDKAFNIAKNPKYDAYQRSFASMVYNFFDKKASKFAKNVDLANLKSNEDKLDVDKLKNVPINLSNLKSKIDKLDVDKLVPAPVDLSKLSDVVTNDVVKKDMYIMLR